jgi:transposase
LPGGGGAFWGGAVNGGSVARSATADRQLRAQASGWRQSLEADRDAPGGDICALQSTADITLNDLRHALAKDGVVLAVSTLDRLFVRRGFTRKKRLHTPLSKSAPTS